MDMAQCFDELMTKVCRLIGFKEPQRLIDGEAIFLNDVMFSIIHEQGIDPNRIYMFVSFGELPRENRIRVVEELLKENHSFRGKGPGFTISPTTGKVVYALHVPLDKTGPTAFAGIMACLATAAGRWRETFFLDQPASALRPVRVSTADTLRQHFS
jgi:hypothetical protein